MQKLFIDLYAAAKPRVLGQPRANQRINASREVHLTARNLRQVQLCNAVNPVRSGSDQCPRAALSDDLVRYEPTRVTRKNDVYAAI
jgi:hypothetical protein